MHFPPDVRQLLAARHNQIAAGAIRQLADHTCLDVDATLHLLMLLLLGFGDCVA